MSRTVTQLLHRWQEGDEEALKALMPLTLEELRRCAKGILRKRSAGVDLQPTELINEAYLRMVDLSEMSWASRLHFFGLAAQMMRNILVDQARKEKALKRGGDQPAMTLDDGILPTNPDPELLLALDEALSQLQALDGRKAQVVALRYFGGLNGQEIAHFLQIDERTVKRDWQFSKVWLFQKLKNRS